MKYEGKIILSNKNNSHTLAFDRIEEISAGRKLDILDVGCSTGYFGAALIERGHRVCGVEPYPPAAAEARKYLTSVYTGGIEEFLDGIPESKFDVIVFGDVLEHLIDPGNVLARLKEILNPNGAVVATVPNITHFAVRAMLLEGRWDYAERGLLDRTHLRFYTHDSVVDLFSDAAYQVDSIDAVQLSAELADELCNMRLKKESIAAAKRFADDHRGMDFQYIVVALPARADVDKRAANDHIKTEKGLRILYLGYVMESALIDIRIREPLKYWAKNNAGTVRFVGIYDHTAADLRWADIVVFQREGNEYLIELQSLLQSQGKKVVFDIDDFLLELPPFLAHHEPSLRRSRPYMIRMMRQADALSVSTSELGRQLSGFNGNLHVTPNFGKPNPERARHFACPPERITLVVASSDGVLVDMLTEPLLGLQKQYGCQIVGIGPPGEFLADHGISVRLQKIMAHVDFCRFISSLDNAIGIIPLDNSRFSSCKSAVKFFDYAMAGLPSVCSNVLPYSDVISSGVNGFLVENETEAWKAALSKLIEDDALRVQISESAHSFVADHHNLDLTARAWSGLFQSLNIDVTKSRSRAAVLADRVYLRQTAYRLLKSAVRPSAYANALSILKSDGIKGVYKRIRRS